MNARVEAWAALEHLRWADAVQQVLKTLHPQLFLQSQAVWPSPEVKDLAVKANTPYRFLPEEDKEELRKKAADTLLSVPVDLYGDVRRWMQIAGQSTPDTVQDIPIDPAVSSSLSYLIEQTFETFDDGFADFQGNTSLDEHSRTALLRTRLIMEETRETLEALYEGNVVGFADGIADLIYVVIGTAVAYGIPLPEVWKIVQASNMAKFVPCPSEDHSSCECGGKELVVLKDAGGKVIKPKSWSPPDGALWDLLIGSVG